MLVKKYILYGHGGAYNHGGEALAKTTIALLRKISPESKIILSTHFVAQDKEFGIDADEFIERDVTGKNDFEKYEKTLNAITPDSVCIHLGGDNYCYPNWQKFAMIHERAIEVGAKSILWSCSVEPDMIEKSMLEVFRKHDLIATRESVSFEALRNNGLSNIVKVSDIAFGLPLEEIALTFRNFVALNLSPLVVRKNPLIYDACKALIEFILEKTDMDVVLVPHVIVEVDNDYTLLEKLVIKSPRVHLVSDRLSASQYKAIIAKARFGIFARTHAAIAAYSSCVPTIALGYSAKALGIAKDLGLDNYVVDINKLNGRDDIIKVFLNLMNEEQKIKNQLENEMEAYIENRVNQRLLDIISC